MSCVTALHKRMCVTQSVTFCVTLQCGKPVEDMKDLGRQRFEGRSDTLSGRPGPAEHLMAATAVA